MEIELQNELSGLFSTQSVSINLLRPSLCQKQCQVQNINKRDNGATFMDSFSGDLDIAEA